MASDKLTRIKLMATDAIYASNSMSSSEIWNKYRIAML